MRAEEWLIDIDDADVTLLTSPSVARAIVDDVVDAFGLSLVAEPLVHAFPATAAGPGGVTTLALLAESHVALHTWPEHAGALLSLGTCRCGGHEAFDWAALVRRHLGAGARVAVRRVERSLGAAPPARVVVGGRR